MSARDPPSCRPPACRLPGPPFQKMKIDAIALAPGFLHFPPPAWETAHALPPTLIQVLL